MLKKQNFRNKLLLAWQRLVQRFETGLEARQGEALCRLRGKPTRLHAPEGAAGARAKCCASGHSGALRLLQRPSPNGGHVALDCRCGAASCRPTASAPRCDMRSVSCRARSSAMFRLATTASTSSRCRLGTVLQDRISIRPRPFPPLLETNERSNPRPLSESSGAWRWYRVEAK